MKVLRGLRLLTYHGSKYECVLCHKTFNRFLAMGEHTSIPLIGGGYRRMRCPYCLSIDRERHFYLYLTLKTRVFSQPTRVLHIAPEIALTKVLKSSPNLDYITADLAPTEMVKADITDLPFADCDFDVIICSHVLEHIPNDRKAMAELFRVLKPTGWALLQVPISPNLEKTKEDSQVTTEAERIKAFGQYDHVRLYGQDYPQRLENAGFKVQKWNFSREVSIDLAKRHGLLANEELFIGVKVENQ